MPTPSEAFEVAESDEELSPHPQGGESGPRDLFPADTTPAPSVLNHLSAINEPFNQSDEGERAKRHSRQSSRASATRNVSFLNMEVYEEDSGAEGGDNAEKGSHATDTMEVIESFNAPIRSRTILRLPEQLRNLGENIQQLSSIEILHISDIVLKKAGKEAHAASKYSNNLWYVPEITNVPSDSPQFDFRCSLADGFSVTLFGRKLQVRVLSYLLRAALLAIMWLIVWSSTIPKDWSYVKGYLLDPYLTIIVSTIVGGTVCRLLDVPVFIGILWCSIFWANIPEFQYFTQGILSQYRTIASRTAIVIVMARTGFSVNLKTVVPLLKNVMVASSALVVETVVHALMAQYYLGYDDWKWSFCQGVIGACPTGAVVMPGVMLLQAEGYGRKRGPVPLMMGALVVESGFAIWAATFLLSAITSDQSMSFLGAMAPVQIIGGSIIGIVAGFLVHASVWLVRNEAQRLPSGGYSFEHLGTIRKTAIVSTLVVSHGLVYLGYEINMVSGGIIASLVMGFFLSNYWIAGEDPEWVEIKIGLSSGLTQLWDSASMPLLFSMAGTNISLKKVFDRDIFPKGLLILVVSCVSRILYVGMSPFGLGYDWKEKLFLMISSIGKVTVQVALAGIPLTTYTKKLAAIDRTLDPEAYAATSILHDRASVFQSILMLFALFPALIVAVWVKKFGPIALHTD